MPFYKASSILCDWSPISSLSPFSGPEGPVNQVEKSNRFLLPLHTSLKIPEHQADYSLPCWPWRSQAPSQPCGGDTTGKHNSTHSTVYTIKHFQVLSGILDPNCCWTVRPWRPVARGASITPSSASSEDQVSDFYSFIWSSNLDCYTDKGNHVLRSDLISRGPGDKKL